MKRFRIWAKWSIQGIGLFQVAKIAIVAGILFLGVALPCFGDDQVRIKDIARVEGVRSNQLIGYGLIVGLNGTGDSRQAMFTVQSISNMLSRFGVTVAPEDVRTRNVAAVMVTADLPAFAKSGDRIDVVLSSLGDARSLQGGTLLMTPLLGADEKVYAVAQGPVSAGGISSSGSRGSNFPTAARIPGGATVEKTVDTQVFDPATGEVQVSLNQPDFTTAARLAGAINAKVGAGTATAVDAGTVSIKVPESRHGDVVAFISEVEELKIYPDAPAKVVINERTGTVVIGGEVRILPVVISHGDLRVEVGGGNAPGAEMSASKITGAPGGESASGTSASGTGISPTPIGMAISDRNRSPRGSLLQVAGPDTISALVQALNAAGASPKDVMAVIEALRAAGALQATVEML